MVLADLVRAGDVTNSTCAKMQVCVCVEFPSEGLHVEVLFERVNDEIALPPFRPRQSPQLEA